MIYPESPIGVEMISLDEQAQFIAAVRSVLPPMTEVLDLIDKTGKPHLDFATYGMQITDAEQRGWFAPDDAELHLEIGCTATGQFQVGSKLITVSEIQHSEHDVSIGFVDTVKVEVTTTELDLSAMAVITKRQEYEAEIGGGAYYAERTDAKTPQSRERADYDEEALHKRLNAEILAAAQRVLIERRLGINIFDATKLAEILALLSQCGPETRIPVDD